MIIEWNILILTCPIAFCLLLCCYATGSLLSRVLFGNNKQERFLSPGLLTLFWNCTGGLIFLAGLYAVIVTHFRTSLLPVPLLACALFRLEPPAAVPGKPDIQLSPGKLWVVIFTALFVYWLIYALHYVLPGAGSSPYIGGDTLFYARAADYLNFSRTENVTIDYLGIARPLTEPYHYGDLWLTAMVQKITGLPPALIVPTIIYPVFAAILFSGMANYIRPVSNRIFGFWNCGLLICCGLTSGFAFLFPTFLFSYSSQLGIPIIAFPKLFFPGIILIAILLSLKGMSWNRTVVIAGAGCLLFINIAPAILITLTGSGIWSFFIRRIPDQRPRHVYLIAAFLALIYYFLFYKINPSAGFNPANLSFSVHTFFNMLIAGLLQFLTLLPFLLILLAITKKNKIKGTRMEIPGDILFLAGVPLSGLLSWGIFYVLTPEAVQFFHNVFIPVSAIAIIWVVSRVLASPQKKLAVLAIVLFSLSVAFNSKFFLQRSVVSTEDLHAVSGFLKKHQPGNFVNIRSSNEFNNWFVRNTMLVQPLPFITYLYPGYYNASLNTPLIAIDSSWFYAEYEKKVVTSAPFSLYTKNRDTTVLLEEYAYLFITEHKIRYLTVSADTLLPQRLIPLVKDSLLLSDNWHIYYIEK